MVLIALLPTLAAATATPNAPPAVTPPTAVVLAAGTSADDLAERDVQHRASRSAVRQQPAPARAIPVRHRKPPTVRTGRPTRTHSAPRYAPPVLHGSIAAVIAYALAQVGRPYVWGAAGPRGFDCSGLVLASWARAGVRLPHSSGGMRSVGRAVPVGSIRAGDILWWPGHVALAISSTLMVEAPHSGLSVRVTALRRPAAVRRLA